MSPLNVKPTRREKETLIRQECARRGIGIFETETSVRVFGPGVDIRATRLSHLSVADLSPVMRAPVQSVRREKTFQHRAKRSTT